MVALGLRAAPPVGGEYIILVGGPSMYQWEKYKAVPHDHWWANFVRAARLRTEQLREQLGPDAKITWLVYRQGYEDRAKQEHQDLISLIGTVRDKLNINLVWFGPGQEVINYLNNGQPRDQLKVIGFEYFGHSNRACFMFDYSNNIGLCEELGLSHRRGNVEKMVRRDRDTYDWRHRQDPIHDGRTADPHFGGRKVGELSGWESREMDG